MPEVLAAAEAIAEDDDEGELEDLSPPKLAASEKPLKLNPKSKPAPTASVVSLPGGLSEVIQQVESLNQEQAKDRLRKLVAVADDNAFALGGVLRLIRVNKWHEGNFYKFALAQYGVERSRAWGLILVYEAIIKLGDAGKPLKKAEWTKVRLIAPYLTKENAAFWIERLNTTENRKALEAEVKNYKSKLAESATSQSGTTDSAKPKQKPGKAPKGLVTALRKMTPETLAETFANVLASIEPSSKELVLTALGAGSGTIGTGGV